MTSSTTWLMSWKRRYRPFPWPARCFTITASPIRLR
jgi:hypothetical protein